MKAFMGLKRGLYLVRYITWRKLWNLFRLRFSYQFSRITGRVWHSGRIAAMSIEPTTLCNLRCPECPSGLRNFSRPTGNLHFEAFQKMLNDAAPDLIHLFLYFQGEPFLNPDLYRMIAHAQQKRIYTAISTNGHYLSEVHCRKILDSGLQKIIISVDGPDAESYSRYRVGGKFETVISGIRRLMAMRQQAGQQFPVVEMQMLVFAHNQHLMPAMRQLAQSLGVDRLQFKSAQIYDLQQGHALVPALGRYARYAPDADGNYRIRMPLPNRCWRMWHAPVLSHDGRVLPCCFDKDAAHAFGMADGQSANDVWKSDTAQAFRKAVSSHRAAIGICTNCTEGLPRVKFNT